jgi:hypothetical protein
MYQKLYLFPPSGDAMGDTYSVGSLSHWTGLKLTLSKGSNRVGVSIPSPEGGNRYSFRYIAFSSCLEFRTMGILSATRRCQNPLDGLFNIGLWLDRE